MVLQRTRDTSSLRSSIEVHRAQVAAGVAERLAPELAADEALPDHALSLDLIGRSVQRALGELKSAERRLIDRQLRCAAIRRESDQLARRQLYGEVVAVRRLIDAQFGKADGFLIHRMKGKTLRKPRRLHSQLGYLLAALEDRTRELPKPLVAGLAPDREAWLRQIEPGYRRLTELLDELTDAELHEQSSRDQKNAALKAFDKRYGEALRLVQATFAFGGCGGRLFKNLRSYVQRRLLSRRAREKREARAEGRLQTAGAAVRSATASIVRWLGRDRSNVA
ncbi:MAG: hypothetical protein AAF657_33785 [Acidobacteriota bacterium]